MCLFKVFKDLSCLNFIIVFLISHFQASDQGWKSFLWLWTVSTDTGFGASLGLTFAFTPLVYLFAVHCKMGIQLYFLSDGFYANTWVFSLYCMFSLLPSAFGSLFNPAVHLSIPNWCPRVDCWASCSNLAFCEASICTVLFHNFLSYSGNIYSSIETWASFH